MQFNYGNFLIGLVVGVPIFLFFFYLLKLTVLKLSPNGNNKKVLFAGFGIRIIYVAICTFLIIKFLKIEGLLGAYISFIVIRTIVILTVKKNQKKLRKNKGK